ncbi:hypothetical protein [Oceanobacillus kapialis]|uniref:Uncharacterized protein n=1 Tax=Oceanobacillus kapialis TaxID=481353 RepID=A0ABW5Q2Y2_9BACI
MKVFLTFGIGFIMGVFITPLLLEWLNLPSFGNLLTSILGEPTPVKNFFVLTFGVILLIFTGRWLYKQAKEERV